jgi:DNA helicase-2/ATP-dependent DNA helicase PcrA
MMDSALIHKAKRDFAIDVATLAKVMDSYETLKKDRNLLDFDDILMLMSAAIRSRPDIATAVHSAYRWFTVDEFQDVNPLQKSVLDLWVGERDDLCVVGDPSQTIYSFTGASSKYLLDFVATYPSATQIELVRCYRCSPEIVKMANAVINGDTRTKALVLRSQQESGVTPRISAYADDHDEAENVAQSIKGLIDSGTAASDIAILFRINAQSAEYETALTNLDIPLVLRGTERFFERPEVKSALMLLRGDAKNSGLSPTNLAEHVRDVLSGTGWSPQAPRGTGAVREKWESLLALMTMAEETDPSTSLSDFIADLDARASVEHAPTADAVSLASIHSAKGLEWPVVFLVGCSEGLLPLSYADSQDGVDEERRLAYVGITRAARILELSWGRSRAPGGKATRTLSRFFVDEPQSSAGANNESRIGLDGSVVRGSSQVTHNRKRTGPKPCRVCGKGLVTPSERTIGRCQKCPGEPNEMIFESLRAWRKEKSFEKNVPAYIVFTDATLTAMAELMPRDIDELSAIPGVGPAKLTEFGAELLEIIHVQH